MFDLQWRGPHPICAMETCQERTDQGRQGRSYRIHTCISVPVFNTRTPLSSNLAIRQSSLRGLGVRLLSRLVVEICTLGPTNSMT